MDKYADIALPVAINKEFTYRIPPELHQSAAVGIRAIVPFGRKYATGLIVGLPAQTTLTSLKPIKDILDAAPIVSEELLRLCRWIADYYFAPLGEVLKAAVPHGFSSASKRIVRASAKVSESVIEEWKKSSPKRAKLLSLLKEHGEMPSTDLQKRLALKTINAILIDMAKAGEIEIEERLSRPVARPRTKEFIFLEDVDPTDLSEQLQHLSPRKKKAGQLLASLQTLQRQGVKEIQVSDLLRGSGASSAALNKFKVSGLLTVTRREVTRQHDYGTEFQTLSIVLNAYQQQALSAISGAMDSGGSKTFLLHGVTGSGKTQVYIEAIRHCLEHEKSAIVLVPEISLTPQIVRRFKSHFGDQVLVLHSRMSAGERHDAWRLALENKGRIVIGPRSAIFAPLANLGLIIVDEEHEASYKQYDAVPRYSARDVAIVRGTHANVVVVLGSATPSAESFANAVSGKYQLLAMPMRIDDRKMPVIAIVDMTAERKRAYAAAKESLPEAMRMKLKEFQQPSLSSILQEKIADRLARKEGVILLQNRRGFAPFVECPDCGYVEMCDQCNVTLTYHMAKKHLRCHYCGLIRTHHTECPKCHGAGIQLHGIGTQRVEQDIQRLFPKAKVLRMDLDTTSRKGAHDRLLRLFGDGQADILLGTQMVAKGLDFPRVTLVGVISADTQMLLPDFRSSERTFQLLTQVAGRAGRSTMPGEVIIQSFQPRHYSLEHVVDHNFGAFFETEMETRRELSYPPFSRMVLIEAKGGDEGDVHKEAERFAGLLKKTEGPFLILGPSPAVIAKIRNQYRWHIIIKNLKDLDPGGNVLRQVLRSVLASMDQQRRHSVRLIIDVDPAGLM